MPPPSYRSENEPPSAQSKGWRKVFDMNELEC